MCVTQCSFTQCHVNTPSSHNGGGICAISISSVVLESLFFTECAGRRGGAVCLVYIKSTPEFSDCLFLSCKGYELGGGAYIAQCTKSYSFVALTSSSFITCTNSSADAALSGAGVHLDIYANTHINTVSDCLFTRNSANKVAGGMGIHEDVQGLDYSVTLCFFSDNSASSDGQDIHLHNANFNSIFQSFTATSGTNRLTVAPKTKETTNPNWLPQGAIEVET